MQALEPWPAEKEEVEAEKKEEIEKEEQEGLNKGHGVDVLEGAWAMVHDLVESRWAR